MASFFEFDGVLVLGRILWRSAWCILRRPHQRTTITVYICLMSFMLICSNFSGALTVYYAFTNRRNEQTDSGRGSGSLERVSYRDYDGFFASTIALKSLIVCVFLVYEMF